MRVEAPCKELYECTERDDQFSHRASEGLTKEMIFELYPEGWVGFYQADRREEREFQAEGTACAKAH